MEIVDVEVWEESGITDATPITPSPSEQRVNGIDGSCWQWILTMKEREMDLNPAMMDCDKLMPLIACWLKRADIADQHEQREKDERGKAYFRSSFLQNLNCAIELSDAIGRPLPMPTHAEMVESFDRLFPNLANETANPSRDEPAVAPRLSEAARPDRTPLKSPSL